MPELKLNFDPSLFNIAGVVMFAFSFSFLIVLSMEFSGFELLKRLVLSGIDPILYALLYGIETQWLHKLFVLYLSARLIRVLLLFHSTFFGGKK